MVNPDQDISLQAVRSRIWAVLYRGANLDVRDEDGERETLLHLAVRYNLVDEAVQLVEAGAR